MNETLSPTTQLTETPAEEIQYRAVSRPAVASLLLGAASALALAHPMLWVVPPLAIAVALVALRSISARPTELIGKSVAYSGLALGILFGAFAPARLLTRESRIYGEARLHADEWLALISEGRWYEAYELHLPAKERHASETDWKSLYGDISTLSESSGLVPSRGLNPDPKESIRGFYSTEPLKTLVARGKSLEFEFQGRESQAYVGETATDNVTLRYELRYDNQGKPENKTLHITLSRVYDAKLQSALWHVVRLSE